MYTDINSDKKQIRLLELVSGDATDDIHCNLTVACLEDSITFEALSYVWGNPKDTLPIYVGGHPANITRNLETALRFLRYTDRKRVLWVDALCINQADDYEKSLQVRIMRDIFSAASQVIAWLGPEYNEEDDLFRHIKAFANSTAKHWVPYMNDEIRAHWKSNGKVLDSTNFFLKLIFLFQIPWFSRIWTIQEAVVATALVYVCGKHSLKEDEMFGMLGSFNKHFRQAGCCDATGFDSAVRLGLLTSLSEHMMVIGSLFWLKYQAKNNNFLQTANTFRYRDATDDRDRVYALFGISRGFSLRSINYQLTTAEVYQNTTREIIRSSRSLGVLSYVVSSQEHFNNLKRLNQDPNDLPSWSCAWTKERKALIDTLTLRTKFHGLFKAAAHQPLKLQETDPGTLYIEGVPVDLIETIAPPFDKRPYLMGKWEEWRAVAGVDQDAYQPYAAGGLIGDAFWRTIASDASTSGDFGTMRMKVRRATSADAVSYIMWWVDYCINGRIGRRRLKLDRRIEDSISQFGQQVQGLNAGRRFFKTRKGYFGVGPQNMVSGDLVSVIVGSRLPLLLREKKSGHEREGSGTASYRFIGDCFVHGIMDGEAMSDSRGHPQPLSTFLLT